MRFKPMKPVPKGRFRQVPPAIFPPLLGMIALALAWRLAAGQFGVPAAVGQLLAGMVSMLAVAAFTAYLGKILRRPAVLGEELRILPGSAGCAAGVVALYALSVLLAGGAPLLARGLLLAGFAAQIVFWLVVIPIMWRVPGQGRVTPVWHLGFVGPIVGAMAALALGWDRLAAVLWFPCAAAAAVIWAISLRQSLQDRIPAPLRPLLAIHLAPVAVLGMVAQGLEMPLVAQVLGVVAMAMLAVAVLGARWLLVGGFSPFWGAFTFPLSASAALFLTLAPQSGLWRYPAAVVLVAATLAVPVIWFKVWSAWIKGPLAVKTNAAVA